MKDAGKKLWMLANALQACGGLAESMPTSYLARVMARGVYLFLDSFLKIAPNVKNEIRREPFLTRQQKVALKAAESKLEKLRWDYDGSLDGRRGYDGVRDALAAHVSALPLDRLWDTYLEIDAPATRILVDEALEVYEQLQFARADLSKLIRLGELREEVAFRFQGLRAADTTPKFSSDILGFDRDGHGVALSTTPTQQKMQLVLGVIDVIEATSEIADAVSDAPWAQNVTVAVLGAQANCLIEMLWLDRPAHSGVDADPSLAARCLEHQWAKGAGEKLMGFEREVKLEAEVRRIRNTSLAHFDHELTLEEIFCRWNQLFELGLIEYLNRIIRLVYDELLVEPAFHSMRLHGMPMPSNVVGIRRPEWAKRFDGTVHTILGDGSIDSSEGLGGESEE